MDHGPPEVYKRPYDEGPGLDEFPARHGDCLLMDRTVAGSLLASRRSLYGSRKPSLWSALFVSGSVMLPSPGLAPYTLGNRAYSKACREAGKSSSVHKMTGTRCPRRRHRRKRKEQRKRKKNELAMDFAFKNADPKYVPTGDWIKGSM